MSCGGGPVLLAEGNRPENYFWIVETSFTNTPSSDQ